ncbi:MAG: carboxypeptidase-like regulatory domain-containing protein, partial [Candidatus Sulfotelmatobacter sp.]
LLIALIVLTALSQLTFAQQTLGSMNGTITDSSGAVVPDVTVKARAISTNLAVSATTKSDGSFSIADLPIDTYEVTFTKNGFQTGGWSTFGCAARRRYHG